MQGRLLLSHEEWISKLNLWANGDGISGGVRSGDKKFGKPRRGHSTGDARGASRVPNKPPSIPYFKCHKTSHCARYCPNKPKKEGASPCGPRWGRWAHSTNGSRHRLRRSQPLTQIQQCCFSVSVSVNSSHVVRGSWNQNPSLIVDKNIKASHALLAKGTVSLLSSSRGDVVSLIPLNGDKHK
jgi:hypothetical protein